MFKSYENKLIANMVLAMKATTLWILTFSHFHTTLLYFTTVVVVAVVMEMMVVTVVVMMLVVVVVVVVILLTDCGYVKS